MRIRIRFSKLGAVKYVGHLDMMRYFQKAIRRAGIDIRYSEGFSPHQIMSFASPLGVGMESRAEYFDIEVNSTPSSAEAIRRLNEQMAEGVEVLSYVRLRDDAKNCMSATEATDYEILFRKNHGPFLSGDDLSEKIAAFLAQEEIMAEKLVKPKNKQKKKRGSAPQVKRFDIRPLIYEFYNDADLMHVRLSSASGNSLNTKVFLESFCAFAGFSYGQNDFMIVRAEVYYSDDGVLKPLESAGECL